MGQLHTMIYAIVRRCQSVRSLVVCVRSRAASKRVQGLARVWVACFTDTNWQRAVAGSVQWHAFATAYWLFDSIAGITGAHHEQHF